MNQDELLIIPHNSHNSYNPARTHSILAYLIVFLLTIGVTVIIIDSVVGGVMTYHYVKNLIPELDSVY